MNDFFVEVVCQWGGSAAILGAYYNFVRRPVLAQSAALVGCFLLALYMIHTQSMGVFLMEVTLGVMAARNLFLLKGAT